MYNNQPTYDFCTIIQKIILQTFKESYGICFMHHAETSSTCKRKHETEDFSCDITEGNYN